MKRVLICGSRDWSDYTFMRLALAKFEAKHGLMEVLIEGCADGADRMAGHRWANNLSKMEQSVTVEHYPALWDLHGKAAGFIRNQQMLTEGKPDAVIAFSKNLATSKGTSDMVRRARKAGVPVWIPHPQP